MGSRKSLEKEKETSIRVREYSSQDYVKKKKTTSPSYLSDSDES
jgi:hypothetical protein